MILKERVRFVKLNGTRGYRHDATPLLLKISIIDLFRFQSTRTACRSQARPFLPQKSAMRAFLGLFGAVLLGCPAWD
ncbi:hypothetical protein BZ164_29735 [Pseudomonas veronii]|nr:hypothetical protein BZ164_29735 [Pseudomonas veronii]